MMFQRGDPNPSDPDLGSFYGLAMPLVKHGIPAVPVQLENATIPGALKDHRVLLMTYEGMKPMKPEVHAALAAWVRQGGALVFVDDDRDPYNAVHSWWNDASKGMSYRSPREHLFEQLGLAKDAGPGTQKVGTGWLIYDASSPAGLTHRRDGADHLRGSRPPRLRGGRSGLSRDELPGPASRTVRRRGRPGRIARPGPAYLARALHQPLRRAAADPRVRDARAGSRHLLLDLDRARASKPAVLASACKTLGAETAPDGSFRFYAEGPDKIEAVVRVALPIGPDRGSSRRSTPRRRCVVVGRREQDRSCSASPTPPEVAGSGSTRIDLRSTRVRFLCGRADCQDGPGEPRPSKSGSASAGVRSARSRSRLRWVAAPPRVR